MSTRHDTHTHTHTYIYIYHVVCLFSAAASLTAWDYEKNVKPVESNVSINLNIFYKIRKLKSIVIINNPNKPACSFNVVYQYTCNKGESNSQTYIGYTEQTLEERFRQHQSVKKHMREAHNIARIKTSELLESVEILHGVPCSKQELLVMEALFIAIRKPPLNSQEEGSDRVLHIF